jgi:hypothetical protein
MSCPYVADNCSGRAKFSEVQHEIYLSTSGKGINLKPRSLGMKELCFYEITAGTPPELKIPSERPVNDMYLTMTFVGTSETKISIIIAESLTSPYVDQCTNIEQGDVIFARVPYKFFPVFEGRSLNAFFSANL